MDNISQDNFGVEDVQGIVSGVTNIVQSIKDKKRAKEAQEWADQNDYWFLSPYAKKLIPIPNYVISAVTGTGITQEAIQNYPKQAHGTTFADVKNGLLLASGVSTVPASTTEMEQAGKALTEADKAAVSAKVKSILPYVLGAAALGIVIYLIAKK